jgi:nucleoid DNA-binding protein
MRSLKKIFLQELRGLPITAQEAETTAHNLIERICSAIVMDGGVESRGKLGSLEVVERKARTYRNPATGETITKPAHRVIRYKPGKELRDALK